MGNRTSLTSTGSENYTTEYVYDDNNRLITETKSAGADGNVTSYTYDANGNTLTKSVIDGENGISGTTYEYNLIGQQTKSTTNGRSITYSYNAQGTRTAKVTSNRYTSYYIDTANVAAEEKNGVITSYIRGINLIASISGNETYYYTFNAHGDVVGLMNESNQLAKSYDYDAFGVEKSPLDEDSNPFRYCGEYYDTETGTYYLRARYYDPRIGRFTSEDKTKEGYNWYSYCINNPIYYSDYSGNSVVVTALLVVGAGALIGGLANIGSQLLNGTSFSELNWRSVGASAVSGAVTAGMGMATGGLSLSAEATIASGAIIGSVGYGTYNLVNGTPTTVEGFAESAATGALLSELSLLYSSYTTKTNGDVLTHESFTYDSNVELKFDSGKIQHEFKHASDYGITENWNKNSCDKFIEAIKLQVSNSGEPILGTYRSTIKVYHYYDSVTHIDSMFDMEGNFVAGWKLGERQIDNLMRCGNVQ